MSLILQIQAQLDKANRNVAELEQALAAYPDHVVSIAANLDSAIRIQNKLRGQLREAAARPEMQVDQTPSCSAETAAGQTG